MLLLLRRLTVKKKPRDYVGQLAIDALWYIGFEETSFILYLKELKRRCPSVMPKKLKQRFDPRRDYDECKSLINVKPPKQPEIN